MSQTKFKNHARRRKQKSPWPMVVLLAGGLLFILGAFFAFSQSAKPNAKIEVLGSPGLRVDKENVDLGNVKIGQTVNVSFQLTNVGDQTLRFTEAPTIEIKEGC